VFNQKLTSNAIANFYQDLLAFLASVTKMIFMAMFLTIFCISSINGQELPDQKFVTDLVTNFNRFGIIYHLPLMKLSHVHDYYKSIKKYK
jgi:predicted CDP-diglyceride synthetase/phosphatidate cytidylyltransferase